MIFKIRNADITYDDSGVVLGVNIRFDYSEDGTNLNGYTRLTEAEYNANSSTMDALNTFVKSKITTKINA